MSALLLILKKNPFEAATVAGVLILLGLCGVLWVQAGRAEARAETEAAHAAQWRAAHDTLRAATDEQAAAVRRLVVESAERTDRANKAIQAAAEISGKLADQAATILASKPPPGVDPCVAARAAFAAELAGERR